MGNNTKVSANNIDLARRYLICFLICCFTIHLGLAVCLLRPQL